MSDELCDHIALETELNWKPPDSNRLSLRERLEKDEEKTGVTDERLTADISMAAEPLWEMFWSIRLSKRGGLESESITYPDLVAYAQLLRRPIAPSEAEALIAMDSRRDRVIGRLESKQQKKNETARRLEGRKSVQSGKTRR